MLVWQLHLARKVVLVHHQAAESQTKTAFLRHNLATKIWGFWKAAKTGAKNIYRLQNNDPTTQSPKLEFDKQEPFVTFERILALTC